MSSVLVVTEDEAGIAATASEWPDKARFSVPARELVHVAVVAYDQSLEELGLEVGPVRSARSPLDCLARPLLPAKAAFTRTLEEDAWSEGLSGGARDFRVLARCPCKTFVERRRLQTRFDVVSGGVIVRGDELFLIGNNATLVLDLTESSTGAAYVPGPSPNKPSALWLAPDGAIWIGGHSSILRWSGRPGEAATQTFANPLVRGLFEGLDGSRPGEPFEAFATVEDQVWRLSGAGSEWVQVWSEFSLHGGAVQEGAVAWIAPGHAVVSLDSRRDVLEFNNGRTSLFERTGTIGGVRAVLWTEEFGVLVGSGSGEIARLADGGFEVLPIAPGVETGAGVVHSMVRHPGGAVFVSEAPPLVGHVVKGFGVCRPVLAEGLRKILGLGTHGDEIVVVAEDADRLVVVLIFESSNQI